MATNIKQEPVSDEENVLYDNRDIKEYPIKVECKKEPEECVNRSQDNGETSSTPRDPIPVKTDISKTDFPYEIQIEKHPIKLECKSEPEDCTEDNSETTTSAGDSLTKPITENSNLSKKEFPYEIQIEKQSCTKQSQDNSKTSSIARTTIKEPVKEKYRNKTEANHECSVCFKKFIRPSVLKIHGRIHSGEQPFECGVCFKKFNQQSNLKKHELIHIGEPSFECNVCSRKFTHKSHLKDHERIHTGERPFACAICSKKFTRHSGLLKHKHIHTGERPFECSICLKKFARQFILKIHLRTHTGEQPFECGICSKRFNQQSNLKKHERLHIG